MDDFKRFFRRGLTVLLPTIVTIGLFFWAYEFVDRHIGKYFTRGLIRVYAATGEPTWMRVTPADALKYGEPIDVWDASGQRLTVEYQTIAHPAVSDPTVSADQRAAARRARVRALWEIAFAKYRLNLIGFVLAVILVYFFGFFLASFLGRTTWRLIERFLHSAPLLRAIYPNIKQVTDFLFSERRLSFSGVLAVEYPRKGVWSIGLHTGPPMSSIQKEGQKHGELVSVFIPSSPTPVTGYVVTVPRSDTIELKISVDEALRFTISGGVIRPGSEMGDPPAKGALA